MMTVTKKFSFSYAHFLPEYKGDCARMHGHNADVEVEFRETLGVLNYHTMVVDFKDIKKTVQPIIDTLDHQTLNDIIVADPPTAETIVKYIRNKIMETPLGSQLIRVRVSETEDSYAEWRG